MNTGLQKKFSDQRHMPLPLSKFQALINQYLDNVLFLVPHEFYFSFASVSIWQTPQPNSKETTILEMALELKVLLEEGGLGRNDVLA